MVVSLIVVVRMIDLSTEPFFQKQISEEKYYTSYMDAFLKEKASFADGYLFTKKKLFLSVTDKNKNNNQKMTPLIDQATSAPTISSGLEQKHEYSQQASFQFYLSPLTSVVTAATGHLLKS